MSTLSKLQLDATHRGRYQSKARMRLTVSD